MRKFSYDPDFTKQAADYLRETMQSIYRIEIGSGHAHAFVAAALGYRSRKAMMDDPHGPSFQDPFLGQESLNQDLMREVLSHMHNRPVEERYIGEMAQLIAAGFTPACCQCGLHRDDNLPIGHVSDAQAAEADWACVHCVDMGRGFGRCRLCGESAVFLLEDLDKDGLCPMHHGEFDMDEEE